MFKQYYVYIMTNKRNNDLYVGVTGNLQGRILQHKIKETKGFTSRYNVNKLVYYEEFNDIYEAITREKQLKGGSRINKIKLINSIDKDWFDLATEWYD